MTSLCFAGQITATVSRRTADGGRWAGGSLLVPDQVGDAEGRGSGRQHGPRRVGRWSRGGCGPRSRRLGRRTRTPDAASRCRTWRGRQSWRNWRQRRWRRSRQIHFGVSFMYQWKQNFSRVVDVQAVLLLKSVHWSTARTKQTFSFQVCLNLLQVTFFFSVLWRYVFADNGEGIVAFQSFEAKRRPSLGECLRTNDKWSWEEVLSYL